MPHVILKPWPGESADQKRQDTGHLGVRVRFVAHRGANRITQPAPMDERRTIKALLRP